jgi:dTDP-4-amino-4,6-dideoxygalactose transaminase
MGTETGTWRITLSDIDFGAEEQEAILDVLRSGWLTLGAKNLEFERRFAEHVGAAHAVAVCNGTAALHLALLAAGVGPGDEVIVPALTFVATANAVLYCQGTPVFADVTGSDDLGIDPADVEKKITSKTKAILPMHYGGYSCDLDALQALARARGLAIVQDACHAPGSSWRGTPLGAIGHSACYSFFGNKNLVTGEGGMITTCDAGTAEFLRLHRAHGMTAASLDKIRGHAFTYDVVAAGYNYRLTEMQAALGIVQLKKLDENNAIRRRLTGAYHGRLARISGLVAPFAGRDEESACHLFCVVLPEGVDRERVQTAMKERGVQTSIHYPPVHRFTSFQGRFRADVPRLEAIAPRLVTLPLHPLMTADDVEVVVEALEASIRA